MKKLRNIWLFSKSTQGMQVWKKILFNVWNYGVFTLCGVALSLLSLSLAYYMYSNNLFVGYLENPYIFLLNTIPVLLLLYFLYGVFSRMYIAFGVTSLVVLGFSTANTYLLKFRDDPLMFADIMHIREAAQMNNSYDMTPSKRLVLCWAVAIVMCVFLFLFCAKKVKKFSRISFVVLPIVIAILLKDTYFDTHIYDIKAKNERNESVWSATGVYVSKGFVYPFINSIKDAFAPKPEGYSEKKAKELLNEFQDADIPDDKKVNIIGVMLEAFCDVRTIGIDENHIDPSVYSYYDQLKNMGYSGKLVSNIFAGGTIDTERAFITGYATHINYRKNVNSYVRYLSSQGYFTEGSHPSFDWFYNRKNVNKYLGFDEYYFIENYYNKYSDGVSVDSIVFPEILKMYNGNEKSKTGEYFGFHVTYQGHGPYADNQFMWTDRWLYNNENVSEKSRYIVNNYLASIKDTQYHIKTLVDEINKDTKPCVILLFGDHKPWLGDSNSVYNELLINLDTSTKDGFLNYYSTDYFIIANDAAKKILGNEFKGNGPSISPNFLMNEVFRLCSWKGNSFMQFSDRTREILPVINPYGFFTEGENFVSVSGGYLDEKQMQTLKNFRIVQSFMSSFCK